MFSFKALCIFTTLGLAAFTSAVPLGSTARDTIPAAIAGIIVPRAPHGPGDVPPPPSVPQTPIVSLPSIIDGVCKDVKPWVDKLNNWTPQAPLDDIKTSANEIAAVLTIAVEGVKGLVGQPLDDVLKTVDGVACTVPQLAEMVAELLKLILTPIGHIIGIATAGLVPLIVPLVGCICDALALLLKAIIQIVGNLMLYLFPLIGTLMPLVLKIATSSLISILTAT